MTDRQKIANQTLHSRASSKPGVQRSGLVQIGVNSPASLRTALALQERSETFSKSLPGYTLLHRFDSTTRHPSPLPPTSRQRCVLGPNIQPIRHIVGAEGTSLQLPTWEDRID